MNGAKHKTDYVGKADHKPRLRWMKSLDRLQRLPTLAIMSHDKHQKFFDLLAEEWDLQFIAEDLERLSHIVDRIDISPGSDIIDLGCGTGILFDFLRRKVGLEGSVTGVDFSLAMALKAHRNFPFDNVNVVDADVSSMPFADDSFDLAVAFCSFANFSDKEESLAAIHRVLKPGSTFYIIQLTSSEELSEMHRRYGGILEHDEIPSEERLRQMFGTGHFENITIKDHAGLYLATATNT